MTLNWAGPVGVLGSPRTPACVTLGAICLSRTYNRRRRKTGERTIETARRDGRPTGRYCLSRSGWWNDLPSFVNTPYRISSVGRWCNAKVPSDLETRLYHVRNTSVARLISAIQFTFDPRLSHALDYMDSCAPSIKVPLLWRLSVVVRDHRLANNTKWHSEKAPPRRVTGTSRHDS